jgi:hypothetical protein
MLRQLRVWRPRYSVRTLVIATVIVSVGLAILSSNLRRTWKQRRELAELHACGVSNIFYRYNGFHTRIDSANRPWHVRLLQYDSGHGHWFGEEVLTKDYFDDVTFVNASRYRKLNGGRITGEPIPLSEPARFWKAINQFPALEHLRVINDQITPADIASLHRNGQLRSLQLVSTALSDAHLKEVGRLQGLEYVSFGGDWYAYFDEGLQTRGTQAKVTCAGLQHLRSLPNLKDLSLFGTTVDDEAAKTLAQMPNLRYLDLGNTLLTDDGLRQLATLKNLEVIDLGATNVTPAGIREFQEAVPDCRIYCIGRSIALPTVVSPPHATSIAE